MTGWKACSGEVFLRDGFGCGLEIGSSSRLDKVIELVTFSAKGRLLSRLRLIGRRRWALSGRHVVLGFGR